MSDIHEPLSSSPRAEEPSAEPISRGRGPFHPLMEVVRTAEGVTFLFDLPGLIESDIHIFRVDHRLSVRGIRHRPEGAIGQGHRGYGEFLAEAEIPAEFDPNVMVRSIRHGVLTLHFAKPEAP